ncbi:MAG: hypothetical protein LBB81_00485 [Treponema sp.]|jgi:hypothetical protein|nr:hypothetical protein [Treponema sp.]
MKKILFVCAFLLVVHQGIFSQNAEKKWTIQMSPLLLFSDIVLDDVNDVLYVIDLEGQYKVSKSSNISLTLSFLYKDFTYEEYDYDYYIVTSYHKETVYQVGVKPMYIHRPFETGLEGFYIGIYPNIGFRYCTIENISKFYTELGFGLNVGYKWIFASGFTMQLGGGIGKTFSIPPKTNYDSFINSDGRITVMHSDILLLDFKLGYSF